MSCATNKRINCSICQSLEKSKLYFCKKCQVAESTKHRNDDGDYIPENECMHAARKGLSSYDNNTDLKLQNLASGDYINTVKSKQTSKFNKEVKKEKHNSLTTSTTKHLNWKKDSETTIVYKNARFDNSNTNVTSTFVCSHFDVCKERENLDRVPRPVACPIALCGRMVTIDSISQHFNFDHAKVPRMILNKSGPQEISLNYTMLSTETICIASFVISQKRISQTAIKTIALPTRTHNSQLVLLMAAKMPATTIKLTDMKSYSRVTTRNSYTQTEDTLKDQGHKLSASKSSSENTIWMNGYKNDDIEEVILLWLCKLDDQNRTYTILVTGEDKKQAYSYIGEAVHIRNEHNPFSIYNKTQCLSVRRSAINKLTRTNEIKVMISTLS